MAPKKTKVFAGPIDDIRIGPREEVIRIFNMMKAFSGPIVNDKQVSTGWLKAIGPSEHWKAVTNITLNAMIAVAFSAMKLAMIANRLIVTMICPPTRVFF